jgi:hypothetical protein
MKSDFSNIKYTEETGILSIDGIRLGFESCDGYRYIDLYGERYLEHRFIWFLKTGSWPINQIDHKNRNSKDNSWDNLRPATNTQNSYNKEPTNTLKYRGIYLSGSKFCAHIKINGSSTYLGTYTTPEEASFVYETKAKEIQGEFYFDPQYNYGIPVVKQIKQTNVTGYTGVNKSGSGFRAQIKIKGIKIHLGTFPTAELAYEAYLNKKKELGR